MGQAGQRGEASARAVMAMAAEVAKAVVVATASAAVEPAGYLGLGLGAVLEGNGGDSACLGRALEEATVLGMAQVLASRRLDP